MPVLFQMFHPTFNIDGILLGHDPCKTEGVVPIAGLAGQFQNFFLSSWFVLYIGCPILKNFLETIIILILPRLILNQRNANSKKKTKFINFRGHPSFM